MPSKARCSMFLPSCGIKVGRIFCWCCPTVVAPTFPWRGPTRQTTSPTLHLCAPSSVLHRTCYVCVSVLTVSCAGSKPVRRATKTRQPRTANMRPPQLELWSAEPHPTPRVYQQLTPQQRSHLVSHLVQLILKWAQVVPTNPPPSTQNQNHER